MTARRHSHEPMTTYSIHHAYDGRYIAGPFTAAQAAALARVGCAGWNPEDIIIAEITNRLTDADIATMTTAVADALETWTVSARQAGAVYLPKSADAVTLERIAAHSIGCGVHDLRDSERDIIAGIVDDMTQAFA